MTLPRPEGVIFDFGDTLLHEGPTDFRAGAAQVLTLARDTNGCDVDLLAGAFADLHADLQPLRETAQMEPPPATVWRMVYEPLGIQFDIPPAEVEWAFYAAATNWSMPAGVLSALAELGALGVPCGVLSNTMFRSETIARCLAGAGFPSFAFVMASADYVFRKPHIRLFRLAMSRLGTDPRRTWFVGDSFEKDVIGAAAAGMVPTWYNHAAHVVVSAEPAAQVVHTWSEFRESVTLAFHAG